MLRSTRGALSTRPSVSNLTEPPAALMRPLIVKSVPLIARRLPSLHLPSAPRSAVGPSVRLTSSGSTTLPAPLSSKLPTPAVNQSLRSHSSSGWAPSALSVREVVDVTKRVSCACTPLIRRSSRSMRPACGEPVTSDLPGPSQRVPSSRCVMPTVRSALTAPSSAMPKAVTFISPASRPSTTSATLRVRSTAPV